LRVLEASGSAVVPGVGVERIKRSAAFEESLFLGLRLNEGVDLNRLRGRFGDAMLEGTMQVLHEVRDAGLLELSPSRMRLTPRGRVLSNEVFSRLLLPSVA
jgi:oxygen-independent coproporphyrinogen-3 oxidase